LAASAAAWAFADDAFDPPCLGEVHHSALPHFVTVLPWAGAGASPLAEKLTTQPWSSGGQPATGPSSGTDGIERPIRFTRVCLTARFGGFRLARLSARGRVRRGVLKQGTDGISTG
jgi:hypothetical protein